ncbi:MAG: metallophosphoesterase family protein [Pseudomonadota bacterium]
MSLLKRFLRRLATQQPSPSRPIPAALEPLSGVSPHYVVGDIHGRVDLLMRMLEAIEDDRRVRSEMAAAKIVFVGDYVDRGDASRAVLEHLYSLARQNPESFVFLRGNHETMLFDFLDEPTEHGRHWLKYGGMQTLESFGIRDIHDAASSADLQAASKAFGMALDPDLVAWLRDMPTLYDAGGNLRIVHAALDPDVPPEYTIEQVRIWGNKQFLQRARDDGLWVAHGHTIVPEVEQRDGRVALDTGAFATGRLSAVGFVDRQSWVLAVQSE